MNFRLKMRFSPWKKLCAEAVFYTFFALVIVMPILSVDAVTYNMKWIANEIS